MKDSLQLKPPNNLNINNLKHNSFYNHQLKIDSITNNNNNINNHLKVNNIDSNINIDISSNNGDIKDNIKPIFEPPKIITPIDEIIQIDLPIDSAEDEAPVDESTQTEVEIPQPQELSPPELIIPPVNIQLKPKPKPGPIGNGGENAIGDELNPVESAPNTKPEPKSKPIPKEKPAPQNSDQQTFPPPPPLDSAVPPKPKPQPRSLLSLLGFEDGPKNLKPKPKPIPKGKPAPPAPVLGRNSPPVPPGKLPPAPPTTTTPPTEPAQTQTQIGMFPSFGETMSFGLSYKSNENTKLHAQMNLLSSPHSVDYSDEAYIKIQAIQDYCSVDYATYCTSMMSDIFGSELSTSSNSNIMPFGNWEGDDDQVDNENTFFFVGFINSIFDVFNNMIGTSEEDSSNGFIAIDFADLDVNDEVRDDDESTPQPPCTRGQMKFPVTPSIPSLSPQSPGVNMHQIQPFMIEPRNRLLHGFHHSHDSHDSEIGEDPITEKEHRQFHPYPKPRPEDARQRPEHLGRPEDVHHRPEDVHHRPEHGFHGKHMSSSSSGSSSSSDSSSSSGSVDNFFFSKPHPLEFPRNFAEAPLTFLGYGTEGDMCLLSNLDSLSIPCQNAIDDAFVLHDQYTMEEENGKGCAFIAGMAGMLLVLTTFVCCKRFYLRPRREKTMKTLNAIHNDPELKSRVEAATGFPVPKPCMLQGNGNENQPCRGKQCVTVILRCMITFALSFLLVRVAAEITIAIANNMIYTNEDGETVEPTPIVVLLIFISFLLVELLIVVGIKKCVRSYVARRQRNSIATSGTNSNIPPTTSSSSPNGGGFGRYFVLPNIPLPTRRFSLFRSNSSNGYSPLMTDEENTVTEMIQSPSIVVASAPSQHQVLYVPPSTVNVHPHVTAQSISSAPSQHQVLYVPPSTVNIHPHVTAQSISSVSML